MSARKDLERLDQFLNDFIEDFEKSVRKELKPVAEKMLTDIKDRTVDGIGVTDAGKKKPFKKLKKSTVKNREYLQKQGKLNSRTTPNSSNQIATGRMVLEARVKHKRKDIGFEIVPPKDREDVQEYQENMGRMALNIDIDQQKQLEDLVKDCADKAIKKATK